ncbi:unnamed protein product [Adineta steineri]|uniref:Uncharacterized protein n=1 Tax=Adineta steineri TaxID=433720 RepID=A0A814J0V4_9BILA|nr:unnamed protein product [Adineta steineri]CAF1031143.1 unnamed protein product [Adineta steineri]
MTSKHHNQSSRRHPLKRVRPDNENQGSIISSNGRNNKKFCRQPSEDSAFIDTEKSSDERAFDLFHKEYFPQFRPYFKHRSIVIQFIEHLWSNMIEFSKVSFVKKILKEQGIYDVSTTNFSDTETFSNDENDSQLSKSLNESNRSISTWNTNNRYSRSFINELLSYLKYSVTPRFIDKKSSSKIIAPLRRSSRIRRAPIKCVCSTCITTRASEEHSSSTSIINDDSEHKIFQHLIEHYHQLDDQYINISNSSILTDINKCNETTDSQIQMPLPEVIETVTHTAISPPSSPIIPAASVNNSSALSESFEVFVDPSAISNEKIILDTSVALSESYELFVAPSTSSNEKIILDAPLDHSVALSESFELFADPSSISNEKIILDTPDERPPPPARRTYVILTELDEPFFGPYPIEFTITI